MKILYTFLCDFCVWSTTKISTTKKASQRESDTKKDQFKVNKCSGS